MTCPNCGQEFEGAACPNCGRPSRSNGGRIAAVIIAVFLVMPCALFGGCVVMVGAGGMSNRNVGGFEPVFGLTVMVTAAVLIGLLYLVRSLWRG